MKKTRRHARDLVNGVEKRFFVCSRRLVESADLSYELERGCSNFFLSDGRVEVEEWLDTPTHALS
jgi:hypothetical protein